jgi:HEAT repeat protein
MKTALFVMFAAVCAMPAFAGDIQPAGLQKAYIEAARDPDPLVRQASAKGMGETGDKGFVVVLSGMAMGDADEGVRVAAIGALLAIGERSALHVYEKAMSDDSEKVRRSAAEALSGRWEESSQKVLMQTLKNDKSSKVRQSAAEALGSPGIMGRLKAHHWDGADDAEAALIQAMKQDESFEVRAKAAGVLAKFKSGKSFEPLMDAMEDKHASVRAAAAESLGMFDKPQAVDRLLDVLFFERDDTVIVSALKSLKYTQDRRLAGPVVQALKSGSAKVRWQAIDLLESLQPEEAVEPLKKIAQDRYEPDGLRAKAHEALQLMGAE